MKQEFSGKIDVKLSKYSKRLLQVNCFKELIQEFLEKVEDYPVQALEYKSFLRFRLAQILV